MLSEEKSVELTADFYKSYVTFLLASLGGEIALTQTVLQNAPQQRIANCSIGLLILTCVLLLGAHEALIRRSSPPQEFRRMWLVRVSEFSSVSIETEWVVSRAAGALVGIGLVLFGLFVAQA